MRKKNAKQKTKKYSEYLFTRQQYRVSEGLSFLGHYQNKSVLAAISQLAYNDIVSRIILYITVVSIKDIYCLSMLSEGNVWPGSHFTNLD